MIFKKQLLCCGLILLGGCALEQEIEPEEEYVVPYQEDDVSPYQEEVVSPYQEDDVSPYQEEVVSPDREDDVSPYQEDVIALENLKTRVVVYCYNSPETSVQDCAAHFEKKGFVRLEEIPRRPAKYDFLKEGTYPTRRWRNGETVSRW